MITRVNSRTTTHTGNLTLPANQNRSLFEIYQTTGSSTIEFGNGGGKIPLATGGSYLPQTAPTGEVTIETTGTYVLHLAG